MINKLDSFIIRIHSKAFTIAQAYVPVVVLVAWLIYGFKRNNSRPSPFKHRSFNTLRPRQNCHHFADGIAKCIFLNENVWISLTISLKFAPNVRINNIPALVQIMAWRRSSDKPLSEPMMVSLPTHICITRAYWVIGSNPSRMPCNIITVILSF